jgi:serine/threonine protein phosphatase PrpC
VTTVPPLCRVVLLQLSRDFGAKMLKRDHCAALVPDPHVAVVELCELDEFLVIGSDGLFEVHSNHKQLVKEVKDTLRATGASFAPRGSDDRVEEGGRGRGKGRGKGRGMRERECGGGSGS